MFILSTEAVFSKCDSLDMGFFSCNLFQRSKNCRNISSVPSAAEVLALIIVHFISRRQVLTYMNRNSLGSHRWGKKMYLFFVFVFWTWSPTCCFSVFFSVWRSRWCGGRSINLTSVSLRFTSKTSQFSSPEKLCLKVKTFLLWLTENYLSLMLLCVEPSVVSQALSRRQREIGKTWGVI